MYDIAHACVLLLHACTHVSVLQMLDHVGTVNSLLENGDLLVRYPSNTLLPVNPQAAKKVGGTLCLLTYIQLYSTYVWFEYKLSAVK